MTFGSNDFIENSSGWNLFDRKLLALTDNLTDYKPISSILSMTVKMLLDFWKFCETMISHMTKCVNELYRTIPFHEPFIFTDCPFSWSVHYNRPFNFTNRPFSVDVHRCTFNRTVQSIGPSNFINSSISMAPFMWTVYNWIPSISTNRLLSFWRIVCFKRTSFALTVYFKTSKCSLSPDKK